GWGGGGGVGGVGGGWAAAGTVLVGGGSGGLGAHVARWLAGQGVARLVLASRRGPAAPGVDLLCDELVRLGAQVRVVACDVADRDAVAGMLAAVPAECPLVGGVHAAGGGQSSSLAQMSGGELAAVLRAKAAGAC